MMKKHLFGILTTIFLVSGCATYQPQVVKMGSVETYISKTTISDIIVAVEPYDTSDKSKSAFSVDMTMKNIKPLQLVIDNRSADHILFLRPDVSLIDVKGNEHRPTDVKYVSSRFEKNEISYAFWGGPQSHASAKNANKAMEFDWLQKEFPEEKTILSHGKTSGFIFFEMSQSLKGGRIRVRVMNLRTNEDATFEIEIL